MTIEEIDNRISELKNEKIEARETEVYSRIVGYYRSVRNWNPGKRHEYDKRKIFYAQEEKGEKEEAPLLYVPYGG